MKVEGITCDICKTKVLNTEKRRWDEQPSVFHLNFPRDGYNGVVWNLDVCAGCREKLYDGICDKIKELRGKT